VVRAQQQQWRSVAERENVQARKKKKKSDSRFLNPNEPYSLGSIFNRGRKQFLAAVQFQPMPTVIAIVAFFKYYLDSSQPRHIRPFGTSFLMNRGIKVGKNYKSATAPFYASVKRQPVPITRVKRFKLH